jgi:sec-independent protein translocase protein TatA
MNAMLGLLNLGGGEVILIFAVVLLLFGAKKLPELARGLGQGIKEFKKATREVTDEVQNAMNENPAPPQKNIPASTVPNQTQPTAPQSPPGQKV